MLGRAVGSLLTDYLAKCELDAIPERRRRAIQDNEHQHLQHLPESCQLGPYVYMSGSRFGLSWRALIAVLEQTGFRKTEWSVVSLGVRHR